MRYQINKREYVNLMTHCRNSAESYDGKRMDLLEALEGTHSYWHGEAADTLRCELRAYLESGEYDSMLREYRRVECELELLLPEIRFQMDLQDRMSLLLSGQHKAEPEELYLDMEMQEEMLDDLAEIDRQINSSVNEAINAMSDIADIVDLSCDMKDLREKQEDFSNMVRQYSMMADENMHGVGKLDLFLCGLFDFLPKNDSSENDNGEGGSEENLPTVYLDLSDTYWLIKDISNTYPELTREQIDVLKRIDRRVKALMPDLSMDDRKCIILEIINGSKKSELEKIYRTCCYSSRDYEILMDNMLKYILGPRNYPVDVWLEDASDMNIALADSYTCYDINRGMRLLYDNHVAYLDALLALCENKGDNTGNADQEYHDKLELLISIIEKSNLLEADIRDGKTFYEAMDQEMPMYRDIIISFATEEMDNYLNGMVDEDKIIVCETYIAEHSGLKISHIDEKTSGYQEMHVNEEQYDIYILAWCYYWNQKILNNEMKSGNVLLNPNTVKAIVMQESRMGTYKNGENGELDVMQSLDPRNYVLWELSGINPKGICSIEPGICSKEEWIKKWEDCDYNYYTGIYDSSDGHEKTITEFIGFNDGWGILKKLFIVDNNNGGSELIELMQEKSAEYKYNDITPNLSIAAGTAYLTVLSARCSEENDIIYSYNSGGDRNYLEKIHSMSDCLSQ